jgi:UTP--glucose-1-phosphate uridylyltransferase
MIRLRKSQPFFGMKYQGKTYDTGSKIGFLMANVAYALEREELSADFRRELEALLRQK